MSQKFLISGFSDEIDASVDVQFAYLKQLGITHFEPRGIDGKNITELTLDEARALKSKMDAAGICVSAIGSPIGKIKITDPMEPHMELLRHTIDIAHILDAKNIRIFSFYLPEGDDPSIWRDAVMERMKQMAALAEQEGVVLMHENEHAIYGESAEACLDLLKTVQSPALSCVFDPANFALLGYDAYQAFTLLKDHIAYFHIKDALPHDKIVPAGHGAGHIPEILAEMPLKDEPYLLTLEPHMGRFAGSENLETTDRFDSLPEGGPRMFAMAHAELVKIINEIHA